MMWTSENCKVMDCQKQKISDQRQPPRQREFEEMRLTDRPGGARMIHRQSSTVPAGLVLTPVVMFPLAPSTSVSPAQRGGGGLLWSIAKYFRALSSQSFDFWKSMLLSQDSAMWGLRVHTIRSNLL